MMKSYCMLLLLILTTLHLSYSLEDPRHPIYSFRCLENKGVELYGLHPRSTVEILGQTNGAACTTTQNVTTGIFLIGYSCMQLQGSNGGHKVNVKVVDGSLLKRNRRNGDTPAPTPTPTPTTTPTLYYDHKLTITCNGIPDTGVDKVVAHVFRENQYNVLPAHEKEVSSLEMRFRMISDSKAPDVSSIYVGDEFYMFIEYKGAADYEIRPETCTAYQGTSVPLSSTTGSVVLWDRNNTGSLCSTHPAIMGEINGTASKKFVFAKMYGFRFQQSTYITILCEVKMYGSSTIPDICPKHTRRRRDLTRTRRDTLDTSIQTKKIIGKLVVHDLPNESANTGSKIRDSGAWMVVPLMMLIVFPRCYHIFE